MTVAVGMSGGVDSSLAAALLLTEGYLVIGLTMAVYGGEPISGKGGGHAFLNKQLRRFSFSMNKGLYT